MAPARQGLVMLVRQLEEQRASYPDTEFQCPQPLEVWSTPYPHIPPSKLYAIASEIAPAEFRMLSNTRGARSHRIRTSSVKFI
jgi:hypothetical protein